MVASYSNARDEIIHGNHPGELMERVEFVLPVAEMHQDEGFCWTIDLPSEIAAGDDSQHHTRSDLQLWQGDEQLGPGHAQHDRIRNVGGGLYSHWEGRLYFSSTSGDVPPARGSVYRVVATKSGRTTANELPAPAGSSSNTLFPRLDALAKELRRVGEHGSTDLLYDPKGDTEQRTKMLEAKVEYLLDELYMANRSSPFDRNFRSIQRQSRLSDQDFRLPVEASPLSGGHAKRTSLAAKSRRRPYAADWRLIHPGSPENGYLIAVAVPEGTPGHFRRSALA